jgi:hypothetical protein
MSTGYLRCLGSRASRRPSPKKLNANIVMLIAMAGKKSCHGYDLKLCSASDASTPQLAMGAFTPSPMKLRKASVNMAAGMFSVAVTMIGPMAFGIKCFHDDLPVAGADCARSQNKVLLLQAENLAPHDPGHAQPVYKTKRYQNVLQSRLKDDHEQYDIEQASGWH